MSDPREYQQPEDDGALDFWLWWEEQRKLADDLEKLLDKEDNDESIEIEIVDEPPL